MGVLSTKAPRSPAERVPAFLAGFALIWGVLYASGLGGVTYGILALGATVAVAAVWEHLVFGTSWREMRGALGLGRPSARGLFAGLVVSALVLSFYPLYVLATGTELPLRSDWLWLLIGLFAFNGLAEELAWRGYVFRRLRARRSFRAAVLWTMPLLAVTHVPIALGNGLVVGVFAMLVAAVTCAPFAYLYERARNTIWAAAMVHASIDAFKLVEVPSGEAAIGFSIALSMASLVLPLTVFAFGDAFFEGRRFVRARRVVARKAPLQARS